jgi:methylmalonyl-CoA/ethylmalonyl-CoA epimerase
MMIQGIGHIGIAVRDLDSVLETVCRGLKITRPVVQDFPERKMKMALIHLGPISLELLEDRNREGWLARTVAERGDHLHHICLVSDDLEKDSLEFEEQGVAMAEKVPAVGLRGKRVIFALSGLLGNIPVEISEP